MALEVFCAPNWRTLESAAIQAWRKSNGKALVIVPSSVLRSWWMSRLAGEFGGVQGEAVVTLERFAERLAQRDAAEIPFRLARPIELRLAAWDAFRSCDVPEQWLVRGVVDAFLNAVEELELHGLKPEDVALSLAWDRNISYLTELWKHWRKVLQERNLWTVGDVLNFGIKALQRLKSDLPSKVIAYGFAALTDLRWNFLQALQSAGVQTIKFFVPTLLSNEQAYRYAQSLLDLLKSQGARVCEICNDDLPDELKCLAQSAFRWQREFERKQETDRIVCVAAAGEEQEVEMVVRILTQWRREGKLRRYSDALVLVRSLDRYLPALEAVSPRYGISFSLLSESGQPAYGLQRLFNALAGARQQGMEGESLWQILPSPYLQVDGKPLLPVERHKETLQRIRQSIAEREIERWLQRLALDEKLAQKLKEFLLTVNELPKEAPASDQASAWRNLLDKFVAPFNGDEGEREALRRVRETLNSLMLWSTNLRLEEVVGFLIDACRLPVQTLGDAICVVTASDGRGLWSPVVALLGLNDDDFPQTPSQFELLTDEHRKGLHRTFKLLTPLKFRSQFLLAERMLFMEAVGSATERLILTCRRTDEEGKPQASSVFLSAVENALLASGWQWRCEERDLGDVLPRNLEEAIDQRDAEKVAIFVTFASAQPEKGKEEALTAQVLRDEDFRLRLLKEWQRWEKPQGGSWDGKVSSLSSHIIEQLRANGLKVTALEDYGRCPYKFFARHILNLQRPQEITYTVDHRTVGILWHEIMAKFLQEWKRKGNLPDEQTLRQIAESVVNTKLESYPDMVRKLVLQQVLSMTEKVWQAEKKEHQEGWFPLDAEVLLDFKAEKLGNVPDEFKEVPITLKIDRIDENKKGQLRVVDYKTGSAASFGEIEKGIALQLPLYAFALGERVEEAVFLRMLQFTQSGYSKRCHLVAQLKHKRNQRQLGEIMRIAVNWAYQFLIDIANANFTVRPSTFESSCQGCEFKAMCRQSKLRLTERLRQD